MLCAGARLARGMAAGRVSRVPRAAGVRRSAQSEARATASTSSSPNAEAATGTKSNKLKEYFLRGFKIVRTVIIGVGIYRAGQVAGVSEYLQDPQSVRNTIGQSLITNSGGTGVLRRDTAEYKRLNRLVNRILKASVQQLDLKLLHLIETRDRIEIRRMQLEAKARSGPLAAPGSASTALPQDGQSPVKILAKKQGSRSIEQEVLAELQKKLSKSYTQAHPHPHPHATRGAAIAPIAVPGRMALPAPLLDPKDFSRHKEGLIALMASSDVQYDASMTLERLQDMELQLKEEILFWASARRSMKGDWDVFVTDAHSVNAFVSHLLPRTIFVCEGLLTILKPSDDELGMVLCHEISHFILQHGKQAGELDLVLSMVRLAFSAVIGYEWFWFLDEVLEKLGKFIQNFDSRQCELEADMLGQQIAARACFDTKVGANIFKMLGDLEGDQKQMAWNSTHPPSLERHATLVELSKTVNREALNPACVGVVEALNASMKPNSTTWSLSI